LDTKHKTTGAGENSLALCTRRTIGTVLLVAGCMALPAMAQAGGESNQTDGASLLPHPDAIDPNIPTPESVLGHEIGDGAARYEAMERYLHALAESSPLATLAPYGESHEGRTLYYLTITSDHNHARLAEIRDANGKLADPRRLQSAAEADRIIEELPGIAWMAYSIHGDELSGTDASLLLAYQLVAGTDERTRRLRDELVVLIDPTQNPDGRERYLQQLQHLTGKVPNTDYQAMQHGGLWSAGRGNHYLFDLNRDWLMMVHPETRGRAEQFLTWNPHLLVDAHEMGSLDTYLFDPPREPLNDHLSDHNLEWRKRFSAEQAKAFDQHGWSYYTRDWYEEWYPGYTNAWASLLGAIGILYEQAGVNAAAVRQASGWTLTYRGAVHRQFVSSLANLQSLLDHRAAVLRDYYDDRQAAVNGLDGGKSVFLVPPTQDRSRIGRFIDVLRRQGIEAGIAEGPFEAHGLTDCWGNVTDAFTLPAGTLVVSAKQPHRRLLRAILDFDPRMTAAFVTEERKELESQRDSRLYDVTAWNLSMAYGLEAYWADHATNVPLTSAGTTPLKQHAIPPEEPTYGYLIDGASSDAYGAIVRLLDHECKIRIAEKSFRIAGQLFPAGSALLRRYENPAELPHIINVAAADLNVDVLPVGTALAEDGPDLGSGSFELLQPPRVAVASQWPISTTSFGATWHLLDARVGLRASPINVQSLGYADLRRYNVLVLPDTWQPESLRGVLDEKVIERLKAWIDAGGTLIALGGSAAFLAGQENGLTSVQLRRNALDEVEVYAEEMQHERASRQVVVDPEALWGHGTVTTKEGNGPTVPDVEKKGKPDGANEVARLKREDEWARRFSPAGCFVAAVLDTDHWLAFGCASRLPVFVAGDKVFMSKGPVRTPARMESIDTLRLSGLLWPEARARLADTAYATVERKGRGQVILFASDPFFRGYLEGTGRLYLNALILGPGLGTSQPVPW